MRHDQLAVFIGGIDTSYRPPITLVVTEGGTHHMPIVHCRICPWRHIGETSADTQREWDKHYLDLHYVTPSDQEWRQARDRALRARNHRPEGVGS